MQEVVYKGQGDYRAKIAAYAVPDQPTAIYLLRNYLRLCMPITIEASINTTTTLVLRDAPVAARKNLVVTTTVPGRPAIIRDVSAPLKPFEPKPVARPSAISLSDYEKTKMQQGDYRMVLDLLCRPSESNLGPAGSPARKDLAKFLANNGKTSSEIITDRNVFLSLQDLNDAGKRGC